MVARFSQTHTRLLLSRWYPSPQSCTASLHLMIILPWQTAWTPASAVLSGMWWKRWHAPEQPFLLLLIAKLQQRITEFVGLNPHHSPFWMRRFKRLCSSSIPQVVGWKRFFFLCIEWKRWATIPFHIIFKSDLKIAGKKRNTKWSVEEWGLENRVLRTLEILEILKKHQEI